MAIEPQNCIVEYPVLSMFEDYRSWHSWWLDPRTYLSLLKKLLPVILLKEMNMLRVWDSKEETSCILEWTFIRP